MVRKLLAALLVLGALVNVNASADAPVAQTDQHHSGTSLATDGDAERSAVLERDEECLEAKNCCVQDTCSSKAYCDSSDCKCKRKKPA